MLGHHTFRKRLCYFVVFIYFILLNHMPILATENNREVTSKANKDSILNTVLLKIATFSPLNPYLPEEGNSLCTEVSKGIPIRIQSRIISSVFKRDGSRQCEERGGIPIKVMQKELQQIGVKVFKAVKGHLSSGRGLSVCGAPTNNINIFYIPSKKMDQVLSKGFYRCIKEKK